MGKKTGEKYSSKKEEKCFFSFSKGGGQWYVINANGGSFRDEVVFI